MNDLQRKMEEHMRQWNAEYDQIMRGELQAPTCFTCNQPASHVTKQITPAGYHAYQCDAHTPAKPAPLWGSDPGWQNYYETIGAARERFAAKAAR